MTRLSSGSLNKGFLNDWICTNIPDVPEFNLGLDVDLTREP
jgi:hypothetical protein